MSKIGYIIATNRKKNKLTQPQLAEKLGENGIKIGYKAISSWEKGTSEPNITTLMQICNVLQIADLYEEFFGNNPMNPLSMLNEEGKAKVLEYAELLSMSHKYDKPASILSHTRQIRQFRLLASAGTGNFLDSDDYDMVEVGDEVPESADFGIKLSGDSMEPKYVDHQVVWVHQQTVLQNGEIGIFCLNEQAFCKKISYDENGTYLISLNTKYKPIQVKEEDMFTIFGKVVG